MTKDEEDAPPLREDMAELYRISEEEQKCVEALRERLRAEGHGELHGQAEASEHEAASDFTLVRFLRARKLSVDDAFEMYVKSLKWRRENRVDAITQRDTPYKALLNKLVSNAQHRWDRHGRPIYMERTGMIHTDEFAKLIPDEIVVRTHIHQMETSVDRMREEHQRSGRPVHQLVSVQDMKGMGVGHRKLVYLFKLVSAIDQDYYPERLGALYMINCPWIFPALWAMCKPFIDVKTRRKIHILSGSDLSPMVEDLGAECLPKEYGGTCECPDGCLLPYVERAELKKLDLPSLISDEDRAEPPLTERRVGRGEKFELELRSEHAEATFKWYFRTASKDISFGAVWRADPPGGADAGEPAPEEVVVAQPRRVDSQMLPQSNGHVAEGPGTLVLTWSNEYSRWSAKALSYHVSVAASAEVGEAKAGGE